MFLGNLPWRWSCVVGDHEYRKQLQRHESVGRTSDSAEQRAPFPLNSFSTSSYVDRMILAQKGEGNPRRRFQTWSDWEGNRVFVVRVSITLGKGSPPSNTSRNSVWWMISCIVIFLPKMKKSWWLSARKSIELIEFRHANWVAQTMRSSGFIAL